MKSTRTFLGGRSRSECARDRRGHHVLFRFRRPAAMLERGDVIVDREPLVVLDREDRGDVIRTRLQGDDEIVFDWPRDFLLSVYRDRNGRPGAIDEETGRVRSCALYEWAPEETVDVLHALIGIALQKALVTLIDRALAEGPQTESALVTALTAILTDAARTLRSRDGLVETDDERPAF